jgi:hypothetical protein
MSHDMVPLGLEGEGGRLLVDKGCSHFTENPGSAHGSAADHGTRDAGFVFSADDICTGAKVAISDHRD